MGLFGGFKAKFSRKSENKESVEQIVCTKYRIQSEFLDDGKYQEKIMKLFKYLNLNFNI